MKSSSEKSVPLVSGLRAFRPDEGHKGRLHSRERTLSRQVPLVGPGHPPPGPASRRPPNRRRDCVGSADSQAMKRLRPAQTPEGRVAACRRAVRAHGRCRCVGNDADDKSAQGLGRVITCWSGCRQTTTGRMSGIVAGFEHILSIWSGVKPGMSLGHPERLRGHVAAKTKSSQASIAAISGLMPTTFMTRVKL
jgi:hypothetical protein